MKRITLLLLILNFSTTLFSQETTINTDYQHQFGFDAGSFVSQFLNFSGSGNTSELYQFSYRKYGETKNTRLGLGFTLSIAGGEDEETRALSTINFRAGKERFKHFGKLQNKEKNIYRWSAFYGVDAKINMNFSSFGSSNSSSNSFTLGAGPAPFFGLQFRINDRLSVSTELSYNFILSYQKVNDKSRYGMSTYFTAPTALFVGYHF